MNETSSSLAALDPTLAYPLAIVPALPPIDADASGIPELPSDHPQWQRDVVSISSRARAIIANVVPAVVRTLAYWDIASARSPSGHAHLRSTLLGVTDCARGAYRITPRRRRGSAACRRRRLS